MYLYVTPDIQYNIFTDSQAAQLALSKPEVSSETVRSTRRLLLELKKQTSVSLQWVRGHNNNSGNELSDYLAKTGACTSAKKISSLMPLSTIKRKVRSHYLSLWQSQWRELKDCKCRHFPKQWFLMCVKSRKPIIGGFFKTITLVSRAALANNSAINTANKTS